MKWLARLKLALGPAFIDRARDRSLDGLIESGSDGAAVDAGPGRIVVVVPAHDEESLIAETLESLAAQTRVADEVIVAADRCRDRTCEIAISHGATVIETVANAHQKAGAIDQVLDDPSPALIGQRRGDDDGCRHIALPRFHLGSRPPAA